MRLTYLVLFWRIDSSRMSQLTAQSLKQIAETRLNEARVLYDNGYYDGAVYLCGYVVEASLKAMICKTLGILDYPGYDRDTNALKSAFFTHNLDNLKVLAGLSSELNIGNTAKAKLVGHWSLLSQGWNSEMRYEMNGSTSKTKAEEMFNALEDPVDGFFTWIKTLW